MLKIKKNNLTVIFSKYIIVGSQIVAQTQKE